MQYYFITDLWEVCQGWHNLKNKNDYRAITRKRVGNYFESKEKAEEVVKKIRECVPLDPYSRQP